METKIKIFNGSRRAILIGILALILVFGIFSLPQAENFSADISTFELNILGNVKPELTQKTADAENLIKKDTDTLTTDSEKFKSEIPKDSENSLMLGNSDSTKNSNQAREELRYFNHGARIVNGTFSGNKIIYADIWPHTDLLVTMLENGVKEDLILKNNQAPLTFEYLVETVGLRLELTPDGGYEFLDRNGQKKFYTPAPDLTDAAGQTITTGISYDLSWEENATSMTADSIQQTETEAEETSTTPTEGMEHATGNMEQEEVIQETSTEEVVEPAKVARPRAVVPVETEDMEHETENMEQEEVIPETLTEETPTAEVPAEEIETTPTEEIVAPEETSEPAEEIGTTPTDEITVVEEAETTPTEETPTEEIEATPVEEPVVEEIPTEEVAEPEGTSTEEIPTEEIIPAPTEETPTEEVVEPAEEAFTEPTEPVTNDQTAFFQKFLPKFLRADLLVTGRETFENSIQNTEQTRQADGSILRRYKLKLTVTNVAGLTYPLDLDPSTFVQTTTEADAQAAEEVSDPTAAVTSIGRNLTTNDLTVRGTLTTSGTNLSIDSGLLHMDSANDRVGIGTTAPLSKLGLLGNFSIGATYGAIAAPTSGLIVEGNVGIGTTAPLSKLGLLGNLSLGATYGAIVAPTSGLIVEGNVGIGTTAPNSKLEISGDIRIASGSGGQIFFADGSSMFSAALGSAASLSNTTDAIVSSDSDVNASGDIILKTGNSDRLHILNSNGYVGIGKTNPATALDVTGTVTATAFAGPLTGAVTGNASTATALAANGSNCDAGSAPLGVDASGAIESCTDYEEDLSNSAGLLAALSDEVGTGYAVFNASPNFTGNVGIGTTAPTQKLDVTGNIRATGDICTDGGYCLETIGAAGGSDNLGSHIATQNIQLSNYWLSNDGGNEGISVDNSGNVGIGKTNPATALDVTGTVTATAFAGSLTGSVTGNSSTATALVANGANCSAGQYPLGVNASGAVENCTADANTDIYWTGTATNLVAATGRTSLGLGGLATLSSVAAGTITDNTVGAAELNVSGNGTTAQYLRSDADGSFTWATPSAGTDDQTCAEVSGCVVGAITDGNTGWDNSYGFTTNTGDITGITNGTGISGGCTSGTCTLSVSLGTAIEEGEIVQNTLDDSEIQDDSLTAGSLAANACGNSELIDAPTFTTVTSSSFLYSSDRNLKTDILTINNSLEKIKQLDGVSFKWKDAEKGKSVNLGFIAQDVEKVFPELVSTDEGTGLKSVQYGNLVAPMVEAIKESAAKVKDLFDKYVDQQEQIDSLEIKNEELKIEKDLDILELKKKNNELINRIEKLEEFNKNK